MTSADRASFGSGARRCHPGLTAQRPVTLTCAHPVAWLPTVAVAVMRVDPEVVGTATLKAPSDPATVVTTLIECVVEPSCSAPTATAAPGAVFPLTTVRARVAPGAGEMIVNGSTAGAPLDPRYLARVIEGWSSTVR